MTRKKRIAILFTGFVRNWLDCYESFFTNFVEPNSKFWDIHCYGFTYDQTDSYKSERGVLRAIPNSEFEKIRKLYGMKNLDILPYHRVRSMLNDTFNAKSERSLGTIYMQPYMIKQSYNVAKGKGYDYIMKLRFDINFVEPCYLAWGHADKINTLSMHSNQDFVDLLVLGNERNMSAYFSAFDNLYRTEWLKTISYNNKLFEGVATFENFYIEDLYRETILSKNIQIHNLPWKCVVGRRGPNPLKLWDQQLYGDYP